MSKILKKIEIGKEKLENYNNKINMDKFFLNFYF